MKSSSHTMKQSKRVGTPNTALQSAVQYHGHRVGGKDGCELCPDCKSMGQK